MQIPLFERGDRGEGGVNVWVGEGHFVEFCETEEEGGREGAFDV